MNRVVIAALLLAPSVVACDRKQDQASASTETPPPPTPPPFTGTLTANLVMAADRTVKPLQPWDDAFAQLQGKLGKPTKIDGKNYSWAAMAGDDCAYVTVERVDGKAYNTTGLVVGAVSRPMRVGKDGPAMNRGDCLDAAGKGAEAEPEDPNAASPPTDGKPASVALVLDNAVKGRSKWRGVEVSVQGVYAGVSGDMAFIAETDSSPHLDCTVKTPLDESLFGKPVIAKGTVKLDKWMSGDGKQTLRPELDPCEMVVVTSPITKKTKK
jgi:hypothetical protein